MVGTVAAKAAPTEFCRHSHPDCAGEQRRAPEGQAGVTGTDIGAHAVERRLTSTWWGPSRLSRSHRICRRSHPDCAGEQRRALEGQAGVTGTDIGAHAVERRLTSTWWGPSRLKPLPQNSVATPTRIVPVSSVDDSGGVTSDPSAAGNRGIRVECAARTSGRSDRVRCGSSLAPAPPCRRQGTPGPHRC